MFCRIDTTKLAASFSLCSIFYSLVVEKTLLRKNLSTRSICTSLASFFSLVLRSSSGYPQTLRNKRIVVITLMDMLIRLNFNRRCKKFAIINDKVLLRYKSVLPYSKFSFNQSKNVLKFNPSKRSEKITLFKR